MTTIDQRLAKPQAVSDLAELGDKLLVAQAALSLLSEGQCRVSAGDLGRRSGFPDWKCGQLAIKTGTARVMSA